MHHFRFGSIAPDVARVLQPRMSVAPRKRQLATKVRRVVKGPGRVKTLHGITAPAILRLVVTLRAKKCKNSSSAQRYNQIRFRFHTA